MIGFLERVFFYFYFFLNKKKILEKDGPYKIHECGIELKEFSDFLDEFLNWTFYGPLTLKALIGQFSFLITQKRSYFEDITEEFFSEKVVIKNIFNINIC